MYVCGVPRDSSEFAKLLEIEQSLFRDISLPPAMARQFFEFRPEIFAAVLDPHDRVAAYSSVFPLKKEWAEAFIAGDVTEPELTPDMMLTRADCHEDASLYIGSVAVADGFDPIMKSVLLAGMLSWRIQQLRHAAIERLSVMMTAANPQGERMIERMGARELNAGGNRRDGYAVYGRSVTPGFLGRASSVIEKCLNSGVVRMSRNYVPVVGSARPAPVAAMPAMA
jgi:hypothetical protein